jgi:hypothetical protein
MVAGYVLDASENLHASIFRVEVKDRRSIQDIQVEIRFPKTPLKGKKGRTAWYMALGAVHVECDKDHCWGEALI